MNKLSPQNFQKLIQQVHTLKIDTADKLSNVIGLVFEKAVDEPGFSETYALMCKELETIKVLLLFLLYIYIYLFLLLSISKSWALITGEAITTGWKYRANS